MANEQVLTQMWDITDLLSLLLSIGNGTAIDWGDGNAVSAFFAEHCWASHQKYLFPYFSLLGSLCCNCPFYWFYCPLALMCSKLDWENLPLPLGNQQW